MNSSGIRNGTTTLFAAQNTLDGTVFGRRAPRHRHRHRHRHREFIAFFDQVEDAVPAGEVVHAFMDNHAPVPVMAIRSIAFYAARIEPADREQPIARANRDPKPFVWTASAAGIMAKLRVRRPNDPKHRMPKTAEGVGPA